VNNQGLGRDRGYQPKPKLTRSICFEAVPMQIFRYSAEAEAHSIHMLWSSSHADIVKICFLGFTKEKKADIYLWYLSLLKRDWMHWLGIIIPIQTTTASITHIFRLLSKVLRTSNGPYWFAGLKRMDWLIQKKDNNSLIEKDEEKLDVKKPLWLDTSVIVDLLIAKDRAVHDVSETASDILSDADPVKDRGIIWLTLTVVIWLYQLSWKCKLATVTS